MKTEVMGLAQRILQAERANYVAFAVFVFVSSLFGIFRTVLDYAFLGVVALLVFGWSCRSTESLRKPHLPGKTEANSSARFVGAVLAAHFVVFVILALVALLFGKFKSMLDYAFVGGLTFIVSSWFFRSKE